MDYRDLEKLVGQMVTVNEVGDCSGEPYVLDRPRIVGELIRRGPVGRAPYFIVKSSNETLVFLDEITWKARDLRIDL